MKIKKLLISQPAPADLEKSPYRNLINKHNVDITFFKFFEVVGIPASEFRKTRIHISEYTAIIFNSKNAIDSPPCRARFPRRWCAHGQPGWRGS